MKYKINICVPVEPLPEPTETTYTCPVCQGIDSQDCVFCFGTGVVSAEKLATFNPEI